MAVYMITYDIKIQDSFEYKSLYEAIKNLAGDGKYINPLGSVWYVDTTSLSDEDIYNILTQHLTIDKNISDYIIVHRCSCYRTGFYSVQDVRWMQSENRTWDTPAYPK